MAGGVAVVLFCTAALMLLPGPADVEAKLDAFKYPVEEESETLVRKKRFLLFPEGTDAIQLIIGVGVPVETTPESIIFGWSFRAVYSLPSNATQLTPSDYGATKRRKRYVSRWDVYKLFENESSARGYGGRSCVLRSICEASDIPMDKFHGLFEELFHSVFSPTSSNEELDHHTDNEYYAAQKLGRLHRGKCKQLFPECKFSLLESFTHSPFEDSMLNM